MPKKKVKGKAKGGLQQEAVEQNEGPSATDPGSSSLEQNEGPSATDPDSSALEQNEGPSDPASKALEQNEGLPDPASTTTTVDQNQSHEPLVKKRKTKMGVPSLVL